MGNMPRPKAEPYGVDAVTLPGAGGDVFVQNPMREVEAIVGSSTNVTSSEATHLPIFLAYIDTPISTLIALIILEVD